MSESLAVEVAAAKPTLASWYGYGYQSDTAGKGQPSAGPKLPPIGAERIIASWLGAKSPDTVKNYRLDLELFARFMKAPSASAAAQHLISLSNGEGNLLALDFRNDMMKRGMAPASVNRRLAALRSFTKAARKIGLIPWVLEVDRVASRAYRDTSGPGTKAVAAMLAELGQRTDAKGARDRAIVRLLFERGLRCCEVVRLDVADVDLKRSAIFILGKHRLEKEWVGLASSTTAALAEWMKVRGDAPGALFVRFQHAHGAGRLSRQGLYRMVRELGDAIGARARPHGLRHSGITAALDAGASVREVQRFSRHQNVNTVLIYDDARRDLGRQVANVIAVPDQRGAPSTTAARPSPTKPAAMVRLPERPPSPHTVALKRGETNKNAKLAEADVLEIRRRHAGGEGPTSLAEAFGVSKAQVAFVVARKSWTHVGGESPRRQRRKRVELSDADVLEIRRRRAGGEPIAAVADVFRISEAYARRIVDGMARTRVIDHAAIKAPSKPELARIAKGNTKR